MIALAIIFFLTTALIPPQQNASPAEAAEPNYDEVRMGAWTLRSDPTATTLLSPVQGVIELSARSADGKVEWYLLDNGGRLLTVIEAPRCWLTVPETNYPDLGKELKNPIIELTAVFATHELCPGEAYRAEMELWLRDFPRAIEAMKERARSLFGGTLERCITPPPPPRDPGTPPPPPNPHPICGFPADRIGTSQTADTDPS
jgi:hypothetical protein